MLKRAYSTIVIKAVDEDQRIIEGVATTPEPDRVGDIVEPEGAKYKLPIPFLWGHKSSEPIGHVEQVKVSKNEITIRARMVKITEPGQLKDRLDMAWQSITSGLVRGLSVGFNPIKSARIRDTFSEHFLEWDWLELSAVVIPANADASITSIKQIDREGRAALGNKAPHKVVSLSSTPGATGSTAVITRDIMEKKTLAEQISAFETKRAASVARMDAIMAKSAETGATLDEAQKQEYDGLDGEVKTIDEHLVRLKAHEARMVAKATPVNKEVATDPAAAAAARGGEGGGIISVRSNVEKGIGFTRYVKALAIARGSLTGALAIAENNKFWKDTTPEVELVLKAAVAAGDTTSAGWASELVYNQNLVDQFIELLRPQTIIGRIPGLTKVPFHVRMSGQNTGSSAFWVGQGKPTPVSKLGTMEVTLGTAKAAGLVVLTEELVRASQPSAELLVRNDLVKAITQFLDVQFVDPDFAPVANVSPGSITNGVTPTPPTGTTPATLRADIQTLFNVWIQANLDPTGGVFIMSPTRALAISLMMTALDQPVFPGINMNGGTFFGLPVVVSNSANQAGSPASGDMIILANAPEILLADDGQVTIDASREASLEMLDNPTNAAVPGTPATTMVSMFQTNSVALKAVRFINWKKRRSTAVAFIQHGAYVA